MGAVEFLRLVWPDTGYYCIVTPHKRETMKWWQHDVFATIEAAAAKAIELSATHDVFFNIHALKAERVWDATKKDGKGGWTWRTHANMRAARCFFADIDCGDGKSYGTREEGIAALIAFCKRAKMPKPLIVSSGRGFHVYWLFDRELPSEVWKEHASNFRKLTAQCGFHVDPTRLDDRASVLRVVGTKHRKDPANLLDVKVIAQGVVSPVEELIHTIETALKSTAGTGGTGMFDVLPGDMFKGEAPEGLVRPPPFVDLGKACGWVRHAARKPAEVTEPQWYQMLNAVRWAEDGRRWCHEISKGHPDYDPEATDAKVTQLDKAAGGKIGPTSCAKMAEVFGNEKCLKCWYAGNPTSSPVVAARRLPAEHVDIGIPPPPHPFSRLKNGGIMYSPVDGDAPMVISEYDLYPKAIIHSAEEKRREMVWVVELPAGRGLREFTIPADAIYDQRQLNGIIAHNGIFTEYDNLKYIGRYMGAYIKLLQQHMKDSEQQTHLGWTPGYRDFILPDAMVTNGKRHSVVLTDNVAAAARNVHTEGSMQKQIELLKFYNHPEYVRQQFFIGCSLGAVLLHATGHHGVLVNLSGESGASKSTSLYTAASLWGSPEGNTINGTQDGATIRARNERVTLMSNLPVCVDEITMMPREDAKNLAMSITQEGGRLRLDNHGKERKQVASLKSTFMLTTSNNSLHELLATNNAAGTAGSMRVFEIAVSAQVVHTKRDADGFLRQLRLNYGHIGPAFVDHVTRHRDRLAGRVQQMMAEIDLRADVKSHERFWSDGIAATIVAMEEAYALGLLPYDPAPILKWALESQLGRMRSTVAANYSSPIDSLLGYITATMNDFLVLRDAGKVGMATIVRGPSRELAGRYETDRRVLYLNQHQLRIYCQRNNLPLNSMIAELERKGIAKRGRLVLGKGTSEYSVGQVSILEVDLRHHEISGRVDIETEVGNDPKVVAIRGGR